jgi:hypothetical protein
MPAMGGAQLTADQVSALAAYVWNISHQTTPTSDNHSALPKELAIPGQRVFPESLTSAPHKEIEGLLPHGDPAAFGVICTLSLVAERVGAEPAETRD